MTPTSYLLFTLDGAHYGLAAEAVQEMFLLPALISVPESGPEVAGVLNLRGQLLPVINLRVCLGYPQQANALSQAVIVVQCGSRQLGLVVDQIQNVEAIAPSSITAALETSYFGCGEHPLTVGFARQRDTVIVLIDPVALGQGSHSAAPSSVAEVQTNRFMAQFSPAERQVLQARAAGLTQLIADESTSDLSAVAVIGLEGERFALGLESVHEFAEVPQITSIPCCPAHIVGNINLRGEILTLVDVRHFLNLTPAAPLQPKTAVVMRLGSLVAGVVIDDVFDVIYLHASEIAATPTAVHSSNNPYLKGFAQHGDSMLTLLDLPKLLTAGDLVVDHSN
ncbi:MULTISPECIES: chemotaxis protein CheW [Cyanophyceae]|uniref:Chemotaxis protein CheW n=1 Tax=Leptolyngbya subtilissima DQ-A4 TaxID=2933933 RepID=A0ABV0JY23_9CYAN|nr:chemotaxis protein CheW [Nodosilinea sp. FACHB-141]MBD2112049.1 chemotaxis protein CheW [Nodosilinea sp. FACHB-141]